MANVSTGIAVKPLSIITITIRIVITLPAAADGHAPHVVLHVVRAEARALVPRPELLRVPRLKEAKLYGYRGVSG